MAADPESVQAFKRARDELRRAERIVDLRRAELRVADLRAHVSRPDLIAEAEARVRELKSDR